jgi:phenylacetate-coenzyme A ligase PaaK-like adenylate-forming protein
MWSDDQLKWYDKQGKARPSHTPHGVTSENIGEHMRELLPHTWKLEGNKLTGMTEMGPLVQMIPTDYVLKGMDDSGKPIFAKVEIQ